MKLTKAHEDKRRTIHSVEGLFSSDAEFTFIHLNQGRAIGGCFHHCTEHFLIIEGKVLLKTDEREEILKGGEVGYFEPFEPHAFFALEDSIISEWGVSAKDKQKDEKDPYLLKFVNKTNEGVK